MKLIAMLVLQGDPTLSDETLEDGCRRLQDTVPGEAFAARLKRPKLKQNERVCASRLQGAASGCGRLLFVPIAWFSWKSLVERLAR